MLRYFDVDAQSIKNTCCTKYKGYVAVKKASGIKKRYILVDTQGLPHVIAVTTAEALH